MQSPDASAASHTSSAMRTSGAAAPASPPDFDFSMPCRYFKSTFARSLSLHNGGANQCKSLDFDINMSSYRHGNGDGPPLPQRLQRAGTSSAAAGHNAKNEVSSGDAKPPTIPARRRASSCAQQLPQLAHFRNSFAASTAADNTSASANVSSSAASSAATASSAAPGVPMDHGNFNKVINQAQHQQQPLKLGNCLKAGSGPTDDFSRNVWPRDQIKQDCDLCDEAEHEVVTTSVATATSNHHHRQQLQADYGTSSTLEHRPPFEVHDNTANVEVVILQNQVDTLQWQLKQVETSCEMYRAVMEEVARFIDRYQSHKQQQRQLQQQHHRSSCEQIARSKSLYHVYGGSAGTTQDGTHFSANHSDKASTAYLRARSSTNLIELPPGGTAHNGHSTPQLLSPASETGSVDEHTYDTIGPANSYCTFKDFTWRRSPKKPQHSGKSNATADDVEDKLNQEAFRLSRTIHNLLNTSTQQPDLTHHRNTRLSKTPAVSALSLHGPMLNSTQLSMDATHAAVAAPATTNGCCDNKLTGMKASPPPSSAATTEMLFLRSTNARDSRCSQRSSTDNSSVHSAISSAASSSSSKVETDEEPLLSSFRTSPAATLITTHKQPLIMGGSTTEDESGFSSINSFQDIGVPLSSTIISNSSLTGRHLPNLNLSPATDENKSETHSIHAFNIDSRNSTLKATAALPSTDLSTALHPNNVLGLPLHNPHDMQHRWDAHVSMSKTTRSATKLQRFSTLSNEDSAPVLWV